MQFGLRTLIGAVAIPAVGLGMWHGGTSRLAAFALVTVALTVWGCRLDRWSWRIVAWNWASALLVVSQLSSNYGWILPLFGVVPGTPDDFVLRISDVASIAVAMVGGTLSLLSLIVGTFVQKLISLLPAMFLTPLLILFVGTLLF